MRVGIDFDGVLFDTASFKQYLEREIPGFLTHYNDHREAYELEPTDEALGIEISELLSRVDALQDFVINDLDRLTSLAHHDLILVSRGPHWFQKTKIVNSGVANYMNEVVIVRDESKDMADIDVLIDDNTDELNDVDATGFHFHPTHTIDHIISFVEHHDAQL